MWGTHTVLAFTGNASLTHPNDSHGRTQVTMEQWHEEETLHTNFMGQSTPAEKEDTVKTN